MKFDFQASKFLAPLVILGSALLTVACGDDDNAEPTKPPVVSDEDAGGGSRDAGGGEDTTEGENTDGPAPGGDASADTDKPATTDGGVDTDDAPVTTDGGVDTVEPSLDGGTDTDEPQGCVENDEACFSCPSTPEQYLKQCTKSECKPFNNAARLGRYVEGQPLPEP